ELGGSLASVHPTALAGVRPGLAGGAPSAGLGGGLLRRDRGLAPRGVDLRSLLLVTGWLGLVVGAAGARLRGRLGTGALPCLGRRVLLGRRRGSVTRVAGALPPGLRDGLGGPGLRRGLRLGRGRRRHGRRAPLA